MKRLPTFLEAEELEALLAASPPRHKLYFLLCARAGLRSSEAASVRHEDITWRDGEPAALRLVGKGNKEALLPLAASLRELLLDFTAPDARGWLFPGYKGHLVDRQARFWLVEACERAGIPRSKAHPHSLRHSFATHLLREDVNLREVQELMRHSFISTTSLYLHTNPQRLQDAVDRLDHADLPRNGDRPDDDLELDSDGREMRTGGAQLHLSPLQFRLVKYLAERAGNAVSSEELLAKVWDAAPGTGNPHVVSEAVKVLRGKLRGVGLDGLVETISPAWVAGTTRPKSWGYRLR